MMIGLEQFMFALSDRLEGGSPGAYDMWYLQVGWPCRHSLVQHVYLCVSVDLFGDR